MKRSIGLFVFVSVVSIASVASADCAEGSFYQQEVTANTVTISPQNSDRTCPDSSGMLREDESTGNVVLLANYCQSTSQEGPAFVDECVPTGTYRYGFALPFDCSERGCGGVQYFVEAHVTAGLPPNCALSAGDNGATQTNETPPWADRSADGPEVITSTIACPSHGCFCDTTSTAVVSMNTVAFAIGLGVMVIAARRRRRA